MRSKSENLRLKNGEKVIKIIKFDVNLRIKVCAGAVQYPLIPF